MKSPWLMLGIAAVCEIAWAVGLKYTQGFTRLGPSVFTVLLMLASFWFLSQAVRTLPIGTAYAVWTGIGAAGTAVLGMLLFDEPRSVLRLLFLFGLIVCLAGLKATSQQ